MSKKTSTYATDKTSQRRLVAGPSGSRPHRPAGVREKPNAANGPACRSRGGVKPRKRSMSGMAEHALASRPGEKQSRHHCCDEPERQINLDSIDEHIIDAAIAQRAADAIGDSQEDPQNAQLEALARHLQECKMEKGIAKACRDWLDAPFCEWNDNLCNHRHRMSKPNATAICVAMADMLSPRDALIMSLVGATNAKVGVEAMLDLAAEPHDPANVIRLYRLLDAAFNDADASPDLERCTCGIDMLADMAAMVCGRFEVQPLTVAAYGSWWVGGDDALDYARQALCLDGQCTLARIICSAIDQGLRPAWRM
ncbi:hypothetical protein OZX74_06010 [Bifidobacterium sp. ESL0798]|uniref:hypothetical protein n=1 Tax=Bifidobacterium sp. ESL0798 TaxID=2983235 RepID=UPI0023F89A46|nr:hypothetical protein [Bifidobacterium sp. ESL0798]WEV73490.1 hypothetical protein OZX74_06010 [Bifidobacterium sp. ESL0798]